MSNYKINVLGSSSSGNTEFLDQFVDKNINSHLSTLGVEFHKKTITIDNKNYNLNIRDTSGQERFRVISSSYLRNTNGIIFFYEITDQDSFNLVKNWILDLSCKDILERIGVVLVGNYQNVNYEIKIQTEQALELANTYNLKFIETSPYTGYNVYEIFELIVKDILEKEKENENYDLKNKKKK